MSEPRTGAAELALSEPRTGAAELALSEPRTVREPDDLSEPRTLSLEDFDLAVDRLSARLADRPAAGWGPGGRCAAPAGVVVALAVQIGYLSADDRADLARLLAAEE